MSINLQAADLPLLIGVIASFLHVISGPDHLAAVAPLAVENNKKAWKIGFSWGAGHVIGMLLIGLLYLIFKEVIPIEKISEHSEFTVGIILIFIGIWSFYRVFVSSKHHVHLHSHIKESQIIHAHHHQHPHESTNHNHTHKSKIKSGIVSAFLIGTLHGFAGVSHFILLIPTLSFQTNSQSALYISGFAIGTIMAMSSFAFVAGFIAKKTEISHNAQLFKTTRIIAGLFALAIGIYWLTL